jgi:hypothetical protein
MKGASIWTKLPGRYTGCYCDILSYRFHSSEAAALLGLTVGEVVLKALDLTAGIADRSY